MINCVIWVYLCKISLECSSDVRQITRETPLSFVWSMALTLSVVWKLCCMCKHKLTHTHTHINKHSASGVLTKIGQVTVVVFSSSFDHLCVGTIQEQQQQNTEFITAQHPIFFNPPVIFSWFAVLVCFPWRISTGCVKLILKQRNCILPDRVDSLKQGCPRTQVLQGPPRVFFILPGRKQLSQPLL